MSEDRTGKKRKPFTLQLGTDDQDIMDFLGGLEYGEKQGWVKAAIRARMGMELPEQDGNRLARIEQAIMDLPILLEAAISQLDPGTRQQVRYQEQVSDEFPPVDSSYVANVVKARRPGFRPKE